MAFNVYEDPEAKIKRVWSPTPAVGESLLTAEMKADLDKHWNPVPPQASVPPLEKKIATGLGPRGNGSTNVVKSNFFVSGYEQNIIYNPGAGAGGEWKNVYTERAVRHDSSDEYVGQGLYLAAGNHTFNGLFTGDNGWQPNVPNLGPKAKGEHRHNVYVNEKAPHGHTFNDVLSFRAASCGFQTRRQTTLNRYFGYLNSIGFLGIYGTPDKPHTINDAVIFGGSYHWVGQGWTGNIALSLYGHTIGTDVTIIGLPVAPPAAVANATVYNGGAICCSRSHHQFPDTPGGRFTAKGDCVIYNWAPEQFCNANGKWDPAKDEWSGDQPFDGTGFRRATGLRDQQAVIATVEDLISAVRDAKLTIADGVKRCQRAVRDALTF